MIFLPSCDDANHEDIVHSCPKFFLLIYVCNENDNNSNVLLTMIIY